MVHKSKHDASPKNQPEEQAATLAADETKKCKTTYFGIRSPNLGIMATGSVTRRQSPIECHMQQAARIYESITPSAMAMVLSIYQLFLEPTTTYNLHATMVSGYVQQRKRKAWKEMTNVFFPEKVGKLHK